MLLKAGLVGGVPRRRREAIARQRVARERPDEVGAALLQPRVERIRVRDVELLDVVEELLDGDVEPTIRDDPEAAVDRILARRVESQELVVLLEVGEVEAGCEGDGRGTRRRCGAGRLRP